MLVVYSCIHDFHMLFNLAVINVGVGEVPTFQKSENWSKVQFCQDFLLLQKGFNGQQRVYFYQSTLN